MYASVVRNPHYKHEIDTVEAVQRGFTKKLAGYHKLSYEHRLAQLNTDSMQTRRVRADLIMCYEMLHGLIDVDMFSFVALSDVLYSIRNCNKLVKPRSLSVHDANVFQVHCKHLEQSPRQCCLCY